MTAQTATFIAFAVLFVITICAALVSIALGSGVWL